MDHDSESSWAASPRSSFDGPSSNVKPCDPNRCHPFSWSDDDDDGGGGGGGGGGGDDGADDDDEIFEEEEEEDDEQDQSATRTPTRPFNPVQCLFCRQSGATLEDNLEHMSKHGLAIPETQLIVDSETLIEYLHLVIFGYFECLYCGSQRQNAQGAQQHMLGKGHCKLNILDEKSEYRDFFEFGSTSGAHGVERAEFLHEDNAIRLASGKVLLHRSQAKPRPEHRHEPKNTQTQPAPLINSGPAISRFDAESAYDPAAPESKRLVKREAAYQTQLASLRHADRLSIMHLPTWKQRALVMESKKQVEKARKQENEMLLKIQLRTNKTLKG